MPCRYQAHGCEWSILPNMLMALGGTLDDWSFGVDVAIGLGTLSTAVVATALGIAARRHEERAADRRGELAAGQVIATVEVREQAQGVHLGGEALLRVVNGSNEVITDIKVEVTGKPEVSIRLASLAAYRPDQQTHILPNSEALFRLNMNDTYLRGPDQGRRLLPEWIDESIHVVVTWRDASNQRWTRTNNGTPARTAASGLG